MSSSHTSSTMKKRKPTDTSPDKSARPLKKPCADASAPPNHAGPTISPHESILADLAPKYNVLVVSILSSSQIRKRIEHVTSHILADEASAAERPRVVLLHARPENVCKMITVAESCKRLLRDKGRTWHQHNQLFELAAAERTADLDVADENALHDFGPDEDDGFEPMRTRFEKAVLPPPRARTTGSLRIFLSVEPIPHLKSLPDVTTQSSEE